MARLTPEDLARFLEHPGAILRVKQAALDEARAALGAMGQREAARLLYRKAEAGELEGWTVPDTAAGQGAYIETLGELAPLPLVEAVRKLAREALASLGV